MSNGCLCLIGRLIFGKRGTPRGTGPRTGRGPVGIVCMLFPGRADWCVASCGRGVIFGLSIAGMFSNEDFREGVFASGSKSVILGVFIVIGDQPISQHIIGDRAGVMGL